MKQKQLLLFICCIVFSGLTFSSTKSTTTPNLRNANNQIGVQLLLTNIDYIETGSGILGTPKGTLSTEKNNVPGLALSLSMMKHILFNNDYIEIKYSHLSGHTNYVGSYNGGAYGSVTGVSSARIMNFSFRVGEGFAVSDNVMWTPFIELGHHQWERGVNEGETYIHNYYGPGILGQYSLNNSLVLCANAMIGNTSGSRISVAGVSGFNASLGNAFIYRLGISSDYAVTQNVHANLGVSYIRFKYGISPLVQTANATYVEPDSRTRYMTIKIGLAYAF